MSPNPGEPEHNERGWQHAICDVHYQEHMVENNWATMPHRLLAIDDDGNPIQGRYFSEPCCYCGMPTDGICVRASAESVHGAKVT